MPSESPDSDAERKRIGKTDERRESGRRNGDDSDRSAADSSTKAERYETARNVGPGDSGAIYDYVVRNGPVSHDEICRNTGWMSPDDIFSCLEALRSADLVEKISGDLDEHGTTRDLWATVDSGGGSA